MRFFVQSVLLVSLAAAPAFAAEAPATPVVALQNARQPSPTLLTGGQPTPEQLAQARAQGYRTVIDLRVAGELKGWNEAETARALGLRYVHIPVAGPEDLTEAKARTLADALQDPAAGPVLLHCASGNRVGALLAIKAGRLDGKSTSEALAIGKAAGMTKLEKVVRERLEAGR